MFWLVKLWAFAAGQSFKMSGGSRIEAGAGSPRVRLVTVIDRLIEEWNHSFVVITRSFLRERETKCFEMDQTDGDISSCWFSNSPVQTSLSVGTQVSLEFSLESRRVKPSKAARRVPFIPLCLCILWVLISSRPFTLTLSNGIACHERSTSQGLVNVGPMFARTRRSMPLLLPCREEYSLPPPYLSERYLAFFKVLGIELKPIFREQNVYIYQCSAHIHPPFMSGADFKISFPATKFCSYRCKACKENSWCIFNGFIFLFCVPAKICFWLERQLDVVSHLGIFADKIPLWGLTCALLMHLSSASSSEGVWVRPGDSLDRDHVAYCSWLRFPPDRQDQCGECSRQGDGRDWGWKYFRVPLEACGGRWDFPKSKRSKEFWYSTNKELSAAEEKTELWHKVERGLDT